MNDRSETTRPQSRDDGKSARTALLPPVDVYEDKAGITLYADLPGVTKEGLNLQIEADALTIEGDISLSLPDGMEATHVEVGMPRYRRVFTLSRELYPEHVSAEFRHGVLKVRIPKAPHAQARRIEVQVH